MTHINYSLLFLLTALSFSSVASVGFKCYSLPNMPVQVYEYGSSNCGSMDSAKASKNIAKNEKNDAAKEMLCMYQALCQTSEDNSASEPPTKTQAELVAEATSGKLKGSILVCKGSGQLDENGMVSDAHCPSPTKCQQDIFYNFAARSMSPGTPAKVVVPGKHEGTR